MEEGHHRWGWEETSGGFAPKVRKILESDSFSGLGSEGPKSLHRLNIPLAIAIRQGALGQKGCQDLR